MIDGIMKGAGELVKGVGNIIDSTVTSAEERGQLKNLFTQHLTDYHAKLEAEISNRHAADMASDSWLSKNIRPLTLLFLMLIVSFMALLHGNAGGFSVDLAYIDLYKSMLMLVFGFYFGSRGFEKIMDSVGKYQIKTKRQMNLEAKAELIRAKNEAKE